MPRKWLPSSCLTPAAIAFAALTLLPASSRAVSAPPGFVVENAFPGASWFLPVQVVFVPDGRKLVVEQRGTVWVVTPAGQVLPTMMVNLAPKVLGTAGRGMLGVALDPDFATNRWIYFAYTVDPDSNGIDDNDESYSRIERYQVFASDPNLVDYSTRQVLIGKDWNSGIPMPDGYHTIGSIRFAPDKSLLIASGEGAHFDATDGGGLDPQQFLPGRTDSSENIGSFRSLSLNSLGGKILRVNKDTGGGLPSNPFWDGNAFSDRSRVWTYGVRNPYRFIIKPGTGATDQSLGQPGTLYIGDTGWNTYEHVKVARQPGQNFGWPCYEGPVPQALYQALTSTPPGNTNVLCNAAPSSENPNPVTLPLIWWHHGDGSQANPQGWVGHAAIGGTFHQGATYPAPYAGAYYMADFVDGWIRYIHTDANDQLVSSGTFIEGGDGPVDIGWDPVTGDLLYVAQNANQVRRIRFVAAPNRAIAVRADSANGTAHYPVPGAASPWQDLTAGNHDFTLANFAGDSTSGWQGNGTSLSPWRLQFDGVNDRATAPPGSVAVLQSPSEASAAAWIRTGSDVTSAQYIFEWLAQYVAPHSGMTLAILGGQLRVFLGSWVDVAPVLPNTWYHVALTKDPSGARVYLDGSQIYFQAAANLGGQASEIVLGASTWRGAGQYGEFYRGAIAQFAAWPKALAPSEVLALFQQDQPLYVPSNSRAFFARADSATGTGPPPVPGAGSPWHDIVASHNLTLANFAGTTTSGWQGDGSALSPYRLVFDGVNDRATIAAGSIPSLQAPTAATVSLWLRTGPDVTTKQYLFEWLSQYVDPYAGMTLIIENGMFRVWGNPWADIAAVEPNTWYFLTVVKTPTALRGYVNEFRRFAGTLSNFGPQTSEIVLGASTYRGAQNYGEHFRGAIGQVIVWRRALIDPEVQEIFHESEHLFVSPPPLWAKVVHARADSATGVTHYPVPGSASPWRDLAGATTDIALSSFNGTTTSGWQGDGSVGSPWRLEFDGVNDRATIPARAVIELDAPLAATAAAWIRTGPDTSRAQSLLEWLAAFDPNAAGMSLWLSGGRLRTRLGPVLLPIATVAPDTYVHVAVVKEPGSTTAFVNGQLVATSIGDPLLGGQRTPLVLGASSAAGNNQYSDFFRGAISQVSIWPGALSPGHIRQIYRADSAMYQSPTAHVPEIPARPEMSAYPNPFESSTEILFGMPQAGTARLAVYAIDGRKVRTLIEGTREAGRHRATWNGTDDEGRKVRPGVFYLRLAVPGGTKTQRVVSMR